MMRMVFKVLIVALVFLTPSVLAQTQNSCVDCHKEQLVKAPYEAWSISVHGLNDATCEKCHNGDPTQSTKNLAHVGVESATEPTSPVYFENILKTCSNCHQDEYKKFTQSKHYLNLRRDLLAPICTTCHGSHYITIVDPLDISEKCSICHNGERGILPDVPTQAKEALVLIGQVQTEISKAQNALEVAREKGHDVSEAEETLKEAESRLEKSGPDWHSFKIYTFKEELLDALYYAATSYNIANSLVSSSCVSCHSTLSPATIEYEKYEQWLKSSHAANGITCDKCHGGSPANISTAHQGMQVPSTDQIPIVCGKCHENPEYLQSIHWENLKEALGTKSEMFPRGVYLDKIESGEQEVAGPECTTCHGGHNIKSSKNPESTIYYAGVPETCGIVCHKKEYGDFTQSEHYKNLKERKLAPECVTCHSNHKTKILGREEIAEFCTMCHISGAPEVVKGNWHAFEKKPVSKKGICGPVIILLISMVPAALYGLKRTRR
ncbi:MAG: ammonia-forming cytochrome c nitrite reductase subunit c552 [Candidatus Hydrothermarchaeaceae archaeon]